jgi:hypothetical protein
MPNSQSNPDYQAWLNYGIANGLIPSDKLKAAGGVDLAALNAANTPTGTTPQFSVPYAALGSIASSFVGGDTNIADNREKGVAEGTLGGAFQGAGQGAAVGSMLLPGIGTLIGAGAGAIIGGIKGHKDKKSEIDAFTKNMELRGSQFDLTGTTALAAYGADLGELGLGGEPTEYNGNSHEAGGIDMGQVEVEDGEIRVGDYVFSDRLLDPTTGKTFAEEAKKVTTKFSEYENDGPSKRTQAKMLEELKAKNDLARAAKEQQDAEMQANMEQDYAAYGAMITKDPAGKYMVDKSNRMDLLSAAKERGMSYNSYIDKLYACGGTMKKKMAAGGDYPTPEELLKNLNSASLTDDGLGLNAFTGMQDTNTPTDFSSVVEPGKNASAPTLGFSKPYSEYSDFNSLDPNKASMSMSMVNEPFAFNPGEITDDGLGLDAFVNLPKTTIPEGQYNPEYEARKGLTGGTADPYLDPATLTPGATKQSPAEYMQELAKKYGAPEKALLASNLPAIANLINSRSKGMDSFDRINLDEVSMDAERGAIKEAIARAKATNRENVRGTATSAGEALAAMSAGNAGLAGKEMDALSASYANEANINTQIRNQEELGNTDISNQEMIARLQDTAMRDSVRNLALSDLGSNAQGYWKDKSMTAENLLQNDMIMSLLKTGEYEMVPDGSKRGFTIKYTGGGAQTTTDTKTETK